ncbi:MAG: CDP-glycerol glycerophosphotransferase family protein [Candidatus Cloacimonetes bacterium]|nr:CDP-glycerol glycerophosphotransferase family protein [Candidatus Cloacimonadota bacterium]
MRNPVKVKFLFFLERELHVPLIKNLIAHISSENLGEIALFSVPFSESVNGIPGRGIRPEFIHDYLLDFDYKIIDNPYLYKPDITFLADFSYQYTDGLGKIVNIGHGTISKGWFFTNKKISRRENCADLICVPGEIHKQKLSNQVYKRIAVTGMPKMDSIHTSKKDRSVILKEMNLSVSNKTLLFAPTFNQELSIVPHIGFNLRKFIPDYINIIVKLHGVAPVQWKQQYREFADRSNNVYYSEDNDITECYIASDIILSDVSSVVYEFASLHKPVIVFDSPTQKQYVNYDPDDLEYAYRDVGIRINNVESLQEAVFRGLINPVSEMSKSIAGQFISHNDGTSSKSVIENSLNLLKDDVPKNLLIIHDVNDSDLSEYVDLYSNRYKILFVTEKEFTEGFNYSTIKSSNQLEILKTQLQHFEYETITYINTNWKLSPSFPDFLISHFKFNEKVGLVSPLLNNYNEVNLQHFKINVNMNSNTDPALIGWNLTYSMTGEEKELPFTEPFCFAVRQQKFNFTEVSDFSIFWLELLLNVKKNSYQLIMAYDCLAEYKPQDKSAKTLFNRDFMKLKQQFEYLNEKKNTVVKELSSQPVDSGSPISDQDIESKLKNAIMENPFDVDRIRAIAKYYLDIEKYDSVDVYTEMIPDDPLLAVYASKSFLKRNKHEFSLKRINLVDESKIDTDANRLIFLSEKGNSLMRNGLTEQAIYAYNNALSISDDYSDALIGKATYYLIKNNIPFAEKIFRTVLLKENNNLRALLGLAIIYQNNQKYSEARELFTQVLKLDEERVDALSGLLKCSYILGDFKETKFYLEKYLELHPADLNMLFSLAGVCYEMKNFNEALAALEKISIFDNNFKGLNEMRNKINGAK